MNNDKDRQTIQEQVRICHWRRQGPGITYLTECGDKWKITDLPVGCNWVYCPNCGGKIKSPAL